MSINVEEVEKAETPCPKTSCRSVQFQTPRLVRSDEMPLEKVQCTSSTSVTPCRVTRLLDVNKFNLTKLTNFRCLVYSLCMYGLNASQIAEAHI